MYRRHWRGLTWGAVAIVVAIAIFTAVKWPGYALPDPAPAPTITVAPPVPTPTITPAQRTGEHTALVDAIPDAVRQFVQQGIANLPEWQADNGAIESWTVSYTDSEPGSPGATSITVQIGQWSSGADASSFVQAHIRAAGPPTRTGDVSVDGKVTGTYALISTASGGIIWWSNGSVVISADGPLDELTDFYTSYPM